MSKLAKALSGAAGNAGGTEGYVEDVFSTFLYDGTNTTLGINNGIDLAGEGGMVWCKSRTATASYAHNVFNTESGIGKFVQTQATTAELTAPAGYSLTSFNSDGFSLGTNYNNENRYFINSETTNVSWTFRKAEKFFDIQKYSGNSISGRQISHDLGSTPGLIIIKNLGNNNRWYVWHESFANNDYLYLNETFAENNYGAFAYLTADPTSTTITIDSDTTINASGYDYVMYLFASDAGGYGDDGTENIIKCGTYTGNGSSGNAITLGFEPQWLLWKPSSGTGDWQIVDSMRQWTADGVVNRLEPNTSDVEATSGTAYCQLTSTGFTQNGTSSSNNGNGVTYIYMAIRRPMKTPTAGTEVFNVEGATTPKPLWKSPFPVDAGWYKHLAGVSPFYLASRITGDNSLASTNTNAQAADWPDAWDWQNGFFDNSFTSTDYAGYSFKRASGFMDVVAYTGNATANRQITHNLNAVPELMLAKTRDAANYWVTYDATNGATNYMVLNTAVASASSIDHWYNTTPTASVVTLGDGNYTNRNATQQILYLFATVAGVSKVGTYTGNAGNAVNVDCGFTGGARFILIKRTDSAGDWYTYDSFQGIVAGNDGYFLMNTTAAQVTNTDYIDPLASGFTVTSSAPAGLNASGGTYIFLAIA